MLPAGTVLAERYRIEEVIGVGGMGMVYRAHDLQLDSAVAIKLLRTDRRPDDETLARFRREILLARKVSHPNVVRLHDIGRDGDMLFLTMDYVAGQTLRELLAEGPMKIETVARLGRELAEALSAAHEQDIVHRDLKPSNILIDTAGRARILDFGVARAMGEEHLTVAGEVVGTPAYLSPEQVRGESVDPRSDIFTLGLILCEALCARLPQGDGTLDELLGQRATGRTTDPSKLCPDLPRWLARILRNCLASKPEDRYQSAGDLAHDLAAGEARTTARRKLWRWSGLAAASILAGILAWQWWPANPPPAESAGVIQMAVLPAANATGRDTMDWAGRSLAQGLAETLAEAPSLRIADSMRLFRLIEDLGLSPSNPNDSERRQLFELLDLDRLIAGRLEATDEGVRIELTVHDRNTPGSFRMAATAPAQTPLDALPDLAGRLLQRLTGRQQELPLPPGSDNEQALAYFDQGLALLSRHETVAAIEPLEQAVAADPDFAAAWNHLAAALATAGRYDRAVDSAETAADLLADHGGRLALEAEARLARLTGESGAAREILETLVERFPGDTKARIQLAELLIDLGRLDAANGHLDHVVEHEPQHGQAWFLLGKTAIMTGDPARAAEDYLVRALVIENRAGNVQSRGDVVNALGIANLQMGNLETAADHFSEAIELRNRAGDRRGAAATRANLAHLSMLLGDFGQARQELALALAEREALGDMAGMADLYGEQGVVEEEMGNYQAALSSYREALRIHETLGHGRALADSYNNVAFAYFMLGEYDNARQFNRSALDLLENAGSRTGRIMALETRGYLEMAGGAWDSALATFVEVLDLSREINQPQSEAVARGGIGLVARHQGRFDTALESLNQALEVVTNIGDTRGQAIYHLHLAELQLDAGRTEAAEAHLDSARSAMGDAAGVMLQTDFRRLAGRIATARGNRTAADEALSESASIAADAGLTPRALRATVALAEIHDTTDWNGLLERAERLDDAVLRLETLTAASRAALEAGEFERAAQLARRGLRPPARLLPWAGNWRLHWLISRAAPRDGADNDSAALAEAQGEVARLLSTMPDAWKSDFHHLLPPELADVETEAN